MIVHHLRDTFRPGWTMGRLRLEYDGPLAYTTAGWSPTGARGPLDYGYIVEDRDRGLDSRDPATLAAKVAKETCIPVGEYVVKTTYSNRFQRMMPLLHDVPGFRGIRLHVVKSAGWTEGCVGAAFTRDLSTGRVGKADEATAWLCARIAECEARGERVLWRVSRDIPAWAAFSAAG
jgi:hypothetical protein